MIIVKKRFILLYALLFVIFVSTGLVYAYSGKKIFNFDKPVSAKKIENNLAVNENEEDANINIESQPEQLKSEETVSSTKDNHPSETDISLAQNNSNYPLHKNITATYFWVGEEASDDNKQISNCPSAWDEDWLKHFGGVDDPNKRIGYFPKFAPKENPFYVALPYNDFDENGNRKKEVFQLASWASSKKWGDNESVCKNQWVKIIKGGKECYAQWQDVGPFKEDDHEYVFGSSTPKSKTNKNAGIDVSPSVRDYLGLSDIDAVDWQFVDASQVPNGDWKKVVTTSQIYWN